MARSEQHDVEAQIRALVDIFIAGITPREALATLDEGPAALTNACFAWAFRAAQDITGLAACDPTRAASVLERAPVVNRLRDAAERAFAERFGDPRTPRLPERPDGLEAAVKTDLDERERRRMSRVARILCRTTVYSVCNAWQTTYYVTRNRDRSRFVLWLQWESGESWGQDVTTQQAWLPARKGLSERDAALILLEDYWTASAREWGTSRPNEYSAYGDTITQDELGAVAARVWPEARTPPGSG